MHALERYICARCQLSVANDSRSTLDDTWLRPLAGWTMIQAEREALYQAANR